MDYITPFFRLIKPDRLHASLCPGGAVEFGAALQGSPDPTMVISHRFFDHHIC